MIIKCENCNKKFDINDDLIPENGRLVKCSNCKNTWFYKHNNEIQLNPSSIDIDITDKNKINDNNKVVSTSINDLPKKTSKKNINLKENNLENNLNKKSEKNPKKDILKIYFNYLSILIISFIAFILIIDTFKISIAKYIPGIIPLLNNLYASLSDLFLFIKDLFN